MPRRPDPARVLAAARRRLESPASRKPDRPARSLPLLMLPADSLDHSKAVGGCEPDARAYRLGECSVIIGTDPADGRQHLSIAHPKRLPTWDEIKEARYRLMRPDTVVAQILPPERGGHYVNAHENCFHLWELPPEIGSRFAD